MKKILIKIAIIIVIIIAISVLLYFILPKKYAVLTYHDFTTGKASNPMQKNIKDFEKEMKYLHDHNYKTLTLKDVECYFDGKCKLPRKSVLITFDDGWMSEYELALPILKKYNFNAVIFYIGSNIDGHNKNYMSKTELDDIEKNYPNIEIASHSFDNHYEDAFQKSKDELMLDFKNMNILFDTKYFAYPYGKSSKAYEQALKESGYKLAFGFGPKNEHRKFSKNDNKYKIPRLNLSTDYSFFKFKLRLFLPF